MNDIERFIEDYAGSKINDSNVDIEFDLGLVNDDFHELIYKYSIKYNVDISNYKWYFHSGEESINFGALFIKTPNSRVERISITPLLLTEFANTKKWGIIYPPHEIPKIRYDVVINRIFSIVVSIIIIGVLLYKYLR